MNLVILFLWVTANLVLVYLSYTRRISNYQLASYATGVLFIYLYFNLLSSLYSAINIPVNETLSVEPVTMNVTPEPFSVPSPEYYTPQPISYDIEDTFNTDIRGG